jgi:spermidine synthase
MMRVDARRVGLLVLGSGFCALVYQTSWLRLLRGVFGTSTAASAAVLAVFMGGLGLGGLLLGPRADRASRPLRLYALLELGIGAAAGLSPWLVGLVERLYVALGGSQTLGLAGASAARLVLSALVLGLPAMLMGGTLPAVVRAVALEADAHRRVVGWLYGANTLGAVAGALVPTFWSLEALGIRKTVWVASLLNLLIAVLALALARAPGGEVAAGGRTGEGSAPPADPPAVREVATLVPAAAALVGFVFLLMELVWYRMLAPILGGSSYTFGLILALALLGIGLGGLAYGAWPRRGPPTLSGFAACAALEAVCLALPFALGDRLAVLAMLLRPLGGAGFLPLVMGWTAVAAIVVLPAAVVAGFQFPLLIALLGAPRERLGRAVGVTYAANTLGAIAGSLAGGFGLLPLLSAPGAWRLAVLLLAGLVAGTALVAWRAGARARLAAAPVALAVSGLLLAATAGPSAFWRHSPIGAGRLSGPWSGPNDLRAAMALRRRSVVWQRDGVESSLALDVGRELSFLVNGKADGSARSDAPTQVMGGLVGSALHPDPRTALVIGLGTGSTAGWLAAVPGLSRVDVVELEPAVVRVAEDLSAVNHDALANSKVHLTIGDGRELLLTSARDYDVIFSEPSNPYRAGVASLFTREFYGTARRRLRPDGVLLQWLQGYELDAQVVRTVYATLGSVFPAVETWEVNSGDLLLVASREPLRHDLDRLRERVAGEPYREALRRAWGVEGAEGFYTGFLAAPAFARAVGRSEPVYLHTDDRPLLEFGFARNLGRHGRFRVADVVSLASARGEDRPIELGAPLDWRRVEELRAARLVFWGRAPDDAPPPPDPAFRLRDLARRAYARGAFGEACAHWQRQPELAASESDRLLLAECLASTGDVRAPAHAEALRTAGRPVEADLALAAWHEAGGRAADAAARLSAAFTAARRDPWPAFDPLERGLRLASRLGRRDPGLAEALFVAVAEPFAVRLMEDARLRLRVELARVLDDPGRGVEALGAFEPHPPWEEGFLAYRASCYARASHPLAARSRRDLARFLAHATPRLGRGLAPPAAP